MIKYYNIPVFLPELACPYRCVYCNQYSITGLKDIIKPDEVKHIIDTHLRSFKEENRFVEVAFFGGNFTGLPLKMQNDYLDVVQPYLDKGLINGIRCSTRPDYITLQRVKEIKHLGMCNIELGAQSTDDFVLKHCNRGHSYKDIEEASQIINSENICLGLQMMLGLPFSNEATDFKTAMDIVNLKAKETRIYPCVVVKDTDLEKMYLSKEYQDLSIEDAVVQSAKLYSYFTENNVKVLRIGLHASDELDSEAYVAGPYHKNFAEMVFSNIWKNKFNNIQTDKKNLIIKVPTSQLNHAIGWKGENKNQLSEKYGNVIFKTDDKLDDFCYEILTKNDIPTILADARMPQDAKNNLKKIGDVIFMNPTDITYKSIASHPDIFFFCNNNSLIYAPNTPKKWIKELKKRKIKLTEGKKKLGKKFPDTVHYNAVGIGNLLIHNLKHTDVSILSSFDCHINVNQAYTRCNLLALNEKNFITSDEGILKAINEFNQTSQSHDNINVLYIDPHQVKLEGHEYGFFPGCCGIWKNNLIVCGSVNNLKEKESLYKFLKDNDFNLIELYDGELIDVGSIFIVES